LIIVWDVSSGTEIKSLSFHKDYVWRVSFTKKDEFIVSAGCDNSCKVIDWKKGVLISEFNKH
jgi:WD40 repeat protein